MSNNVYLWICQHVLAYTGVRRDVHRTARIEGAAPTAAGAWGGTAVIASRCGGRPLVGPGGTLMSLFDDLVSNLIERNVIRVNGTFTITLVDGGVALKGNVASIVR